MPDTFVSLREASRLLTERGHPVSRWQLWDRAERGLIPAERIAGRWLIRRENLLAVTVAFEQKAG